MIGLGWGERGNDNNTQEAPEMVAIIEHPFGPWTEYFKKRGGAESTSHESAPGKWDCKKKKRKNTPMSQSMSLARALFCFALLLSG
jgi:hypothetical protein